MSGGPAPWSPNVPHVSPGAYKGPAACWCLSLLGIAMTESLRLGTFKKVLFLTDLEVVNSQTEGSHLVRTYSIINMLKGAHG
jgi:hypothetical protein